MFHFSDIGLETDLIVLIALAMIIILLILCIVLLAKNSGLRRRYEGFMADSDGRSLEKAFQKKFDNMDFINEKLNEMEKRLRQ